MAGMKWISCLALVFFFGCASRVKQPPLPQYKAKAIRPSGARPSAAVRFQAAAVEDRLTPPFIYTHDTNTWYVWSIESTTNYINWRTIASNVTGTVTVFATNKWEVFRVKGSPR